MLVGIGCGAASAQLFLAIIGVVVPGLPADPEAHLLLVDHIDLGQQVEAVGDDIATIELDVGVARGRTQDGITLLLGAHAQVVAECIVEAHG
ncbi:hypothetical protein D3C84_739990 [compost metagenome]